MSEESNITPEQAMAEAIANVDLEASTSVAQGKVEGSPAPPESDQASGETGHEAPSGNTDAPQTEQGVNPSEGESGVDEDALLQALGEQLGTTPAAEEEKVKRDLAASSKEARLLNDVVKGVADTLSTQGIELVRDSDGAFIGFRATGPGGEIKTPQAPIVDDAMQDRLLNNTQATIDGIWESAFEQAKTLFAVASPDLESVSHPPSPQKLQSIRDGVAEATDKFGNKLYPNFEKLENVVTNMAAALPPVLREAYNEDPDTITRLLADSAENARLRLLQGVEAERSQKEKAQKATDGDADLFPTGDAVINVGNSSDAAREYGRVIAESFG
jgi:hypothetical protein